MSDGIWVAPSYLRVFSGSYWNYDATQRQIRVMRTYVSLLVFAIGINLAFAVLTYIFFYGQIEGAYTFGDYVFYAIGSLTTSELGNMTPKTLAVKLWTSLYVLTAWVYIFYVTVNHITDVKFKFLG